MTHFRDMSDGCQFRLSGGAVRAIGWLSIQHEYSKGTMATAMRDLVLKNLESGLHTDFYMGQHVCEYCYDKTNPGKRIGLGDEAFVSGYPAGNGAIIIPGKQHLFVAPVLISHYIEEHEYLPPSAFIDALLDSPNFLSEEWFDRMHLLTADLQGGNEYVSKLAEYQKTLLERRQSAG